eukprot:SAG11_NODE_2370_length_3446_cov_320.719749_2_plen_229_part_00
MAEPEPEGEHELQTPAEEAMIEAVKATEKFTVNVIVTFRPTTVDIEQLIFDVELNSLIDEHELMMIIQKQTHQHKDEFELGEVTRYLNDYKVWKISVAGPDEFWKCLEPRKPGFWLFKEKKEWIDEQYQEMIRGVDPETQSEEFKNITAQWERAIQRNEEDWMFDHEDFEEFINELTRKQYNRLDEKYLSVGPDGLQHLCDNCGEVFARYYINGVTTRRRMARCRKCM